MCRHSRESGNLDERLAHCFSGLQPEPALDLIGGGRVGKTKLVNGLPKNRQFQSVLVQILRKNAKMGYNDILLVPRFAAKT